MAWRRGTLWTPPEPQPFQTMVNGDRNRHGPQKNTLRHRHPALCLPSRNTRGAAVTLPMTAEGNNSNVELQAGHTTDDTMWPEVPGRDDPTPEQDRKLEGFGGRPFPPPSSNWLLHTFVWDNSFCHIVLLCRLPSDIFSLWEQATGE